MPLNETYALAPVESVFDRVRDLINDRAFPYIVLDFELSYTRPYLDWLHRQVGDENVEKHLIVRFHSRHSFIPNQEDFENYSPEWVLGFRVHDYEFFCSNLEEFRDASREFMLNVLKPSLLKHQSVIVGQNLLFDLTILAEILELTDEEILRLRADDLMLMSYSLDTGERRRSLAILAKRHLKVVDDEKVDVGRGHFVDVDWKKPDWWHRIPIRERLQETLFYNRSDLRVTDALHRKLRQALHRNQQDAAQSLFRWFLPFYTLLLKRGLHVNEEKAEKTVFEKIRLGYQLRPKIMKSSVRLIELLKKKPRIVKKVSDAARQLDEKTRLKFEAFFDFERFQFRSFDEKEPLSEWLSLDRVSSSNFREFVMFLLANGFSKEFVSLTEKGTYSFDQDRIELAIKKLSDSDEIDRELKTVLEGLLALNSLKANVARVKAFWRLPQIYKTRRLHHEYRLTGTETGRISSVKPGVMNMPKELQSLISSDGSFKIGQVDLSSAEAKLFMMFLQRRSILEELKKNPDTYSVIGRHVFGIEISKKTRPVERNIMKVSVLANMYGQTMFGLAQEFEKTYQPVMGEVCYDLVTKKEKYPFFEEWGVISYIDRKEAHKVLSALEKKQIDLEEAKRLLSSLIKIDFLKLAVEVKSAFDALIRPDVYEDWICRSFFRIDDPENSYAESPVKIRRKFDMSPKGLGMDGSESALKAYTLLLLAYWLFFKKGKVFSDRGLTLKRLSAFGSFGRLIRFGSRSGSEKVAAELRQIDDAEAVRELAQEVKRSPYFSTKFPELFSLVREGLVEAYRRVASDARAMEFFSAASKRLAARYREALNFPVQGTSSYLNSLFGYELQKRAFERQIRLVVFNTVHDSVQFEFYDLEREEELRSLIDDVYNDTNLIQQLIEPGLRSIHGDREFTYLPIGGELDLTTDLSQCK